MLPFLVEMPQVNEKSKEVTPMEQSDYQAEQK